MDQREPFAASDLIFTTPGVTAAETAAVTAVLAAALAEAATSAELGASGPTAWQRSQRGLRTPIARGPGAWRGFSG
jgi:hypothetical protein